MDKNNKPKKAWYKRVWVWIGIIVLLMIVASAANSGNQQTNNTPTNTPAATEQPKAEKWDYEAAYAKITNGMTKTEVEAATGKPSESCTVSEDPTFGKTEICTYGNAFIDKAALTVTFHQDVVSSKSKSTY